MKILKNLNTLLVDSSPSLIYDLEKMNIKIILAYQSNCAVAYIGEFPLNMYRNPKKVKTHILTAASNFTFTEVNLFKEIRKRKSNQ